jgi:predicted transcriptional regulator of viral defense system
MRLDQALARIQQTEQTVMRTADVMALLDVNKDHASQILSRLAGSGHLLRLKRGTWLVSRTRDPLPLVGYLTAPLPSYVSLQTALYHHGMISQMPTVIYCVSLTRTRVYATPVGTFSVHHISAPFFGADEQHGVKGVKMATPEKALLDFLYLSSTKTRLFAALPELDLSVGFSIRNAERLLLRIPSRHRRTMVQRNLRYVTRASAAASS